MPPAPARGCPSVPTDGPGCWNPTKTACETSGLAKSEVEPLPQAGQVPTAQPALIWGCTLPMFNEVLCTDVSDCVYAHVVGSGCLAQCLHLSVSGFGHLGLFPLPDQISPQERVCVAEDLIAHVVVCMGRCSQLSMRAEFAQCLWVMLGCQRCFSHCQHVLSDGGWVGGQGMDGSV